MNCSGCEQLLESGWRFCPVCGVEVAQGMLGEEFSASIEILGMDGKPITEWKHLTYTSIADLFKSAGYGGECDEWDHGEGV